MIGKVAHTGDHPYEVNNILLQENILGKPINNLAHNKSEIPGRPEVTGHNTLSTK